MRYFIIILSTFLILCACQHKVLEQANLEGDLYYTCLKFGSFYGQSDSLYHDYIHLRDSLGIEALREEDASGISDIELLENHDLKKSPFIYIKTDVGAIVTVFMRPQHYEPITEYTYQQLIDRRQKVRLKLSTDTLSPNLHICKKVYAMEIMEGETLQKQRKFKIEDYR